MKVFLAVAAITTVLIGGFFVMKDPGHVPLFDANLNRLAETEREGFCSGIAFWGSRGDGDAKVAEECRTTDGRSTEINLSIVLSAFCTGVQKAGFPGDVTTDCYDVLVSYRYWPTYDGQITDAWTRSNPYPGELFAPPTGSGSRTGERETTPREGELRP